MKRLSLLLLILLLVIPTIFVNAENLLNYGETILDERINPDGIREIFTELDGKYYKKIIKDDELIEVELIELRPTGLKDNPNKKDRTIGDNLSDKLGQMGISEYNLPLRLDYSNSQYLPPVGRQMENSCVGWAVGYYLRTYQQGMDLKWKIKDGEIGDPSRVFSPSFIYNQINNGTDGGAFMEDAGDLLRRMGASPLENFAYTPGDYWTQPDSRAIHAAYPHRIRDWKILYTKNDSDNYIIQKTKEYLNTEDLMVAGLNVGFKFNYPYFDEYDNAIITTDNTARFGHAVVVVGYDDNLETPEGYGAFKIINSYGKDWGNDGFAYLSYEAFATNARAGYVYTDLLNENSIKEPLNTEVFEGVSFDIEFTGSGRYDVEVANNNGVKIYEEKNILGQPGINKIYWNGLNLNNNPVGDGNYIIKIQDLIQPFTKASKLNSASSYLNKQNGEVESVDINISTKEKGTMDLYIESKGKKIPIYKGVSLYGNKEYNYNIDILKYVNSRDLVEAKVLIDIQ